MYKMLKTVCIIAIQHNNKCMVWIQISESCACTHEAKHNRLATHLQAGSLMQAGWLLTVSPILLKTLELNKIMTGD